MTCIYCQKPTILIAPGVAECPACESLISTEPAPAYEADYHAYKFSVLRPKFWFLAIKAMRSGLRRGLTVCDIGCGAGHSLVVAKWFGCTTIGVDPMILGMNVRGARYFYGDLTVCSDNHSGECDLVWCWHTLEHAQNPIELLRFCLNVLKPGGDLWLEFPEATNFRRKYNGDLRARCMFPEHRGLPSRTWATRTLLNLGASVVTLMPPRNACWLYGRRDKGNDVVLRVKKR